MKKFFMDLLSADNPLSSKRFAGLCTLLSCIILAFIAAYENKGICPDYMYNGLLLVVSGLFGFNMAEAIFKKTETKTEDSEEPKEEPKEELTEKDETK